MYRREARRIIAAHGGHAHQHVLDLMVEAVRRGDEADALHYEKVLREVDHIRHAMPGHARIG